MPVMPWFEPANDEFYLIGSVTWSNTKRRKKEILSVFQSDIVANTANMNAVPLLV